jgi:ADP-heptose:LPS heptosyltransferase
LVIHLRSIGDTVLLIPALRLLKEWRPELRVSVVIEPRFRELLEGNPDVDEIPDPGTGSGWAKVEARGRALREIRARRFALCLNFHGGPTSALLAWSSGARWKAGFEHFRQRRIYQILIPDGRTILGQPTIHAAEHQASALFYLGLPRQQIPPARLVVAAEHEAWWEETRLSLSVAPSVDYALLHPAALYATKQWAPENFARLGVWLEGEAGLPVVYACGPGETAVLDTVERAAGRAIRRLAAAGLGQFAAALAGASSSAMTAGRRTWRRPWDGRASSSSGRRALPSGARGHPCVPGARSRTRTTAIPVRVIGATALCAQSVSCR